MKLRKINDIVVKPVKPPQGEDKRPVRGAKLFPEADCNVLMIAKKKSGKSTVIYKMIKECAGPQTKIIAFGSTIYKDKVWLAIQQLCRARKIEFIGHMHIGNNLHELVAELQIKAMQEEAKKLTPKDKKQKNPILYESDSDSEDEDKPKKSKLRSADYFIIIDDLAGELKNPDLLTTITYNRHFHLRLVISTQYWNHTGKSGRNNLDYVLLFPRIPKEKLIVIHTTLDLSGSYEDFEKMYHEATKDKHNFLYIDLLDNQYRKNFNLLFDEPEDDN